jgi:hypothetical protein
MRRHVETGETYVRFLFRLCLKPKESGLQLPGESG